MRPRLALLAVSLSVWAAAVGCSSEDHSSGSPDAGLGSDDGGNPDSGVAADTGTADTGTPDSAPADGSSSDGGSSDGATMACTNPTSGTTARFAANAVTLPMKRTDFAYDLDGDGTLDNQFGSIVGALTSQAFDLQGSESAAVAAGSAVLLIEETSDDPTGQSDSCAGALLSVASPTSAPPKFDGTDVFTAELQSAPFQGPITGGELDSESPATTTTPVSATLRLALFGSTTIDLHLVGSVVQLKRTGNGPSPASVHGAIPNADVQNNVLPQLANSFNAEISANPTSSSSMQLLQVFDTGGTADATCGTTCSDNGTCATKGDGQISICEVTTNGLIQSLFAPDIQLYDAQGNWHPTPGGTAKDSLSVGIGLTAVPASF